MPTANAWLFAGDGLGDGSSSDHASGRRSRYSNGGAHQDGVQHTRPKAPPRGHHTFNLARLYGSTIGIAAVQISIYNNTQAMHLALAKHLTPDRVAAYVFNAASTHGLAMLNEMLTEQAGVVAVIDEFKILMIAMLIVSPLVLFLSKSRSGSS